MNFRKITRLGDAIKSKVSHIPQQSYFIHIDDGPEEIDESELEVVFNAFEQVAYDYENSGEVDLSSVLSMQHKPHQLLWASGQWFSITS